MEALGHRDPGGNITGLSWQSADTSGERFELGNEVVPDLRRIALFFDDSVPLAVIGASHTKKMAEGSKAQIREFIVRDAETIDEALSASLRFRPQLFIVIDSALTMANRERFTRFAIKAKVPLISEDRA